MLVPVLSSRVSDPRWFNTDPDPAFFSPADPDPGLFCECNSSYFRKNFHVFFFSYPHFCYPEYLLNNNFLFMRKNVKRTFLQIWKNISKFKCNIYTWIRGFQAAEGHSDTAPREGCAEPGNWKISPHPQFQIQSIKRKIHHYMSHHLAIYRCPETMKKQKRHE